MAHHANAADPLRGREWCQCGSLGCTGRSLFWVACITGNHSHQIPLIFFFFAASDERELPPATDLCPLILAMATLSPARVALMFVGLLTVMTATTFNTLSEFGARSGKAARGAARPAVVAFRSFCLSSDCHSPPPPENRHLPTEGGGRDPQVLHADHAGAVGLLCLGLHLLLDLRHVPVLPGGTLQKVCPPAPLWKLPLLTHHPTPSHTHARTRDPSHSHSVVLHSFPHV